jgi:hypothetical protein
VADLDPGILLSGMYTTHPIMPASLTEEAQQASSAASNLAVAQESQARTGLIQTQTQAGQLTNQQNQIALNNQMALGKAYAQLRGAVQQTASSAAPAPSTSVATGNTASAIAANATSTSTDTSSTPSTGTGAPSPVTSSLPPGVDPSWKVDKAINWWIDGDGKPVSLAQGPAYRPDGSLNMQSSTIRNAIPSLIIKNGGTPAFAQQIQAANEDHANEVDTGAVSRYDTLMKAREAQATADKARSDLITAGQQHNGDLAYSILNSNDPRAMLLNSWMNNENFRNAVSAQVDPKQPLQGLNDPRIPGILQNLSNASPVKTNVANLQKTEAETQATESNAITARVNAATSQGQLTRDVAQNVNKIGNETLPSAAVLRQSQQAASLDAYIDNLYKNTTPAQRTEQIAIGNLPPTVKSVLIQAGMVPKDASDTAKVQLTDLIKAANAQQAQLDATVQSNDKVKGSMGSDLRAKMAEEGAGSLSLADNESTWATKMGLRQNYRDGASDVAGKLVDQGNAAIKLALGAAPGATNLDPNAFTVEKPTPGSTKNNLPGATPAGPVKVSSPAEAAKLPKGTTFVTPDGRTMVVR